MKTVAVLGPVVHQQNPVFVLNASVSSRGQCSETKSCKTLGWNPQITIEHVCFCVFREILVEESNVQRVDSPVTVSYVLCRLLLAQNWTGNEFDLIIKFCLISFFYVPGVWRYSRSVL